MRQAPSPALHRLRFILAFAYMSGMRLAELATAKLAWLRHEQFDDGEWAWSIMVLGKRNKWREVPLPDPAMAALRESLERRGLEPDPLANDPDLPLICKLNLAAPLSAARGSTTSWWMASSGVHGKLWRKTSAQRRGFWKRPRTGCATRTVLTLQREGCRRHVLQANLGHESLATTSIYVRVEKARKHRAMQEAFAGPAGKA